MLSLPDYMRRVDTKLEPANVIGSFLAAKKYASDEAYKKGQSELAKQKFEANEKYRAQQMDLQKQELKTMRENKLLNLQAQNFQAYSNQVSKLNLPDDQKMDLLNQAMSGMPEYYEAMGRPKPMITPKGNLYYNKEGVIDQALIDSLNLSEEGKSLLESNKGRRFSADFVQKQDGQVQFMGTPKIFDVSEEKGSLPSYGNYSSLVKTILETKDEFGNQKYSPDQATQMAIKILKEGKTGIDSLRNQGVNIPDQIYEELGDKTEVKGEDTQQNEIQEEVADFVSDTKEDTGPNPILYKKYQKEYELLDFLRKKIQEDSDSAPKVNKKIKSTQKEKENDLLEFNSVDEAVSANLKPGTIVLINGRKARLN